MEKWLQGVRRYWICLINHSKSNREFIGDEYGTKRCKQCGKFWYRII